MFFKSKISQEELRMAAKPGQEVYSKYFGMWIKVLSIDEYGYFKFIPAVGDFSHPLQSRSRITDFKQVRGNPWKLQKEDS